MGYEVEKLSTPMLEGKSVMLLFQPGGTATLFVAY